MPIGKKGESCQVSEPTPQLCLPARTHLFVELPNDCLGRFLQLEGEATGAPFAVSKSWNVHDLINKKNMSGDIFHHLPSLQMIRLRDKLIEAG